MKTATKTVGKIEGAQLPSHQAVTHLVDHLRDSFAVTNYKVPEAPTITELMDDQGVYGHTLVLPAPSAGFRAHQLEKIESLAQALSYWGHLMVEIESGAKQVEISFRLTRKTKGDHALVMAPDEEAEKPEENKDRFQPKAFRVAKSAGKNLMEQGFKVREPVPATLLTMTSRSHGYTMMVRYPYRREEDSLGLHDIYDRVVPLLAETFARENGIKSDGIKEEDHMALFFTSDKNYLSSHYDTAGTFRMITPRATKLLSRDFIFFTRRTYRAGRSLMAKYKKDFRMLKRPVPAMHRVGHTVVMSYRQGAHGKTVDDAYAQGVSTMARKLMKKYHVRASFVHDTANRFIIVTFYSEGGGGQPSFS